MLLSFTQKAMVEMWTILQYNPLMNHVNVTTSYRAMMKSKSTNTVVYEMLDA